MKGQGGGERDKESGLTEGSGEEVLRCDVMK